MLEYLKPTAILLAADPGSSSTSSCGSSGSEDDVLDDMLGGDSSAVCKFAAGASDGSGGDPSVGGAAIFS